ncbi:hypothetical protein LZ32DRAFT_301138 [Colletotrichum eremochloae]|nr:hypothetical protein LZ32DRAFT_301138 [Colletotrichum eremochloae]
MHIPRVSPHTPAAGRPEVSHKKKERKKIKDGQRSARNTCIKRSQTAKGDVILVRRRAPDTGTTSQWRMDGGLEDCLPHCSPHLRPHPAFAAPLVGPFSMHTAQGSKIEKVSRFQQANFASSSRATNKPDVPWGSRDRNLRRVRPLAHFTTAPPVYSQYGLPRGGSLPVVCSPDPRTRVLTSRLYGADDEFCVFTFRFPFPTPQPP